MLKTLFMALKSSKLVVKYPICIVNVRHFKFIHVDVLNMRKDNKNKIGFRRMVIVTGLEKMLESRP